MYRIDYDSSDEEYFDEWSCSFEKTTRKPYKEKKEEEALDPLETERHILNACIDGDIDTVKQYYSAQNSTFNVNQILVGNHTLLMQAASYAQNHIVDYLLELGANPNTAVDGITPLMCACASPSLHNFAVLECVKLLVDKKALVNIGDKYGVTPLMRAVMSNKLDVVNYLLKKDVNMEMRNNIGRTAIFYAVEYKLPAMLWTFIKKEACLENVDRRGFTILMLAKADNSEVIMDILKQVLPAEEEEQFVSTVSDGLSWLDMLPNTSVATTRPAFCHEISGLLRGMNCTRLESLIADTKMDLATFLTMDDESLKLVGVNLPYERLKFLSGLKEFHIHGWKMASVLGLTDKKKEFNSLRILDVLASHMKNITVLKSSIDYCISRSIDLNHGHINSEKRMITKEIDGLLKELHFLKRNIKKVNKNNFPAADLILPDNPVSMKSFKKVKFVVGSTSVLVLVVVLKAKYKISFNDVSSLISNCVKHVL